MTEPPNAPLLKRPKCPTCRWHLSVEARDLSWEARCLNRYCPVDLVPASLNWTLARFVGEREGVYATDVAERFGWTVANANNHLTSLMRVGVLCRRRVDPKAGGKRFLWVRA